MTAPLTVAVLVRRRDGSVDAVAHALGTKLTISPGWSRSDCSTRAVIGWRFRSSGRKLLVIAWLSARPRSRRLVVLSRSAADGFVPHSNHTVVPSRWRDGASQRGAGQADDAAGNVVTVATALGTKFLISPRLTLCRFSPPRDSSGDPTSRFVRFDWMVWLSIAASMRCSAVLSYVDRSRTFPPRNQAKV